MQSTGKVTIITAVARKKVQPEKDKGELMENNVDLMEVWGLFGDFNLSKKRENPSRIVNGIILTPNA